MLDTAQKYESELKSLFINTWYNDKFKFLNGQSYYSEFKLETESWQKHQFVSLDKQGKVIGFIEYSIVRDTNNVLGFEAVNFSDNKYTYGKDLTQVISDIFSKYNFRKLSFSVICGNPIEKTYDKFIQKIGGRIVGTKEKEVKLIDGKFYDLKMYELLLKDYFFDYFKKKKGLLYEKIYTRN